MDNTIINVRCRTNLDKYKGKDWPTIMSCRPLKGDRVVAKCGATLHVVDVTHTVGAPNLLDTELAGVPYLIVELHKWYPGLGGRE